MFDWRRRSMIQNSCLPTFKRWKRWKRWKGQRNRQHFATLHPHIYWPSKKYENMKAFWEPSSWYIYIYIWYYEWANTADFKILFKSYRFVNTKSFPIFKSLFTCWWDNVFIGIKEDFLRKYFVFLTKSISIFFVLIVLMEEGGGIWQGLSLLTLSTIPFSTMALTPPPLPTNRLLHQGEDMEKIGDNNGTSWSSVKKIWNISKWILSQYLANSIWLLAGAKLSDSSNFPQPDGWDNPPEAQKPR